MQLAQFVAIGSLLVATVPYARAAWIAAKSDEYALKVFKEHYVLGKRTQNRRLFLQECRRKRIRINRFSVKVSVVLIELRLLAWLLLNLCLLATVVDVRAAVAPLVILFIQTAYILTRRYPNRRPVGRLSPRRVRLTVGLILALLLVTKLPVFLLGVGVFFLLGRAFDGSVLPAVAWYAFLAAWSLVIFYLVMGTAHAFVAHSSRVLILRRFCKTDTFELTAMLPLLRAFGEVITLLDVTFSDDEHATYPALQWRLFQRFFFVSEQCRYVDAASWEREVRAELRASDLVICHLIGLPTKALAWEIDLALQTLGNDRLVVATPYFSKDMIGGWLRQHLPANATWGRAFTYMPNPLPLNGKLLALCWYPVMVFLDRVALACLTYRTLSKLPAR